MKLFQTLCAIVLALGVSALPAVETSMEPAPTGLDKRQNVVWKQIFRNFSRMTKFYSVDSTYHAGATASGAPSFRSRDVLKVVLEECGG
jgi:hypothetical protein